MAELLLPGGMTERAPLDVKHQSGVFPFCSFGPAVSTWPDFGATVPSPEKHENDLQGCLDFRNGFSDTSVMRWL
ncbi:hypothetical protein [Paracoccus sp. T5]|uniref:hypothetical protein n=1 Tax=Paracoccus sp. T5 TaxID=3402161 RepID=UPI003AE5E324